MAKTTKKTERDGGDSLVYCGPTIPGAAKQYTVYNNGLPTALEKRAEEAPEIRGLLVPLDRMPETMKNLRGQSGHVYRLYRLVAAKSATLAPP